MAKWKDGERVRIVQRAVTADDRANDRYFEHMGGLVGTVQNVYSEDEVVVRVDPEAFSTTVKQVHNLATKKMHEKFIPQLSEEVRAKLTPEEKEFAVNYVLLVRSADLEKE